MKDSRQVKGRLSLGNENESGEFILNDNIEEID